MLKERPSGDVLKALGQTIQVHDIHYLQGVLEKTTL